MTASVGPRQAKSLRRARPAVIAAAVRGAATSASSLASRTDQTRQEVDVASFGNARLDVPA
jgi:hypothetical protein